MKNSILNSSSEIDLPVVKSDSFLTLHYRMSGSSGDIINTFSDKPATLSLGSGTLSEAVEQRLIGLKEGTRATFDLPENTAFGERNPEMVQWVSKKLLANFGDPSEEFQVGDVLKFPTPDGKNHYAGAVVQLRDDAILFDFNHPLAGKSVTFEVHIIGVL